jgi:predicted CXXCH cytochrome family protein
MKRLILFGLLAVSATLGYAHITGSAHDFTGETWSGGQICIVCHTPHNSITTVTNAPLWNHAVTTQTFVPYSSSTLNAVVGQPGGHSKLCLSCHDGTVALDSYGTTTGTTMLTGGANVGIDLSNDHPISFVYNTALATADGGLFDPATKVTALGGTINANLLSSGEMQCSSCHDVHNKYNLGGLLKISNAGSGLCITCHDK